MLVSSHDAITKDKDEDELEVIADIEDVTKKPEITIRKQPSERHLHNTNPQTRH